MSHGTPGVEPRLPLMLTLVSKGVLTLPSLLAEFLSSPPKAQSGVERTQLSRLLIAIGMDHRCVAIAYQTLEVRDLRRNASQGKGECTLFRGEVIYEEGVGFAKPGLRKILRGKAYQAS